MDFFCGADFEYLVIMDRDNVLSFKFLAYAAAIMEQDPSIEIVQPEVRCWSAAIANVLRLTWPLENVHSPWLMLCLRGFALQRLR